VYPLEIDGLGTVVRLGGAEVGERTDVGADDEIALGRHPEQPSAPNSVSITGLASRRCSSSSVSPRAVSAASS
jgi:hypothetical protein